jgi:hypothetical protein
LGANLDAIVAFPAKGGVPVESLHLAVPQGAVLVQVHQVNGADVHAGGFVLPFAAITFFGKYITWHIFLLSLFNNFAYYKYSGLKSSIPYFPFFASFPF